MGRKRRPHHLQQVCTASFNRRSTLRLELGGERSRLLDSMVSADSQLAAPHTPASFTSRLQPRPIRQVSCAVIKRMEHQLELLKNHMMIGHYRH